jgi:hypothetical protein
VHSFVVGVTVPGRVAGNCADGGQCDNWLMGALSCLYVSPKKVLASTKHHACAQLPATRPGTACSLKLCMPASLAKEVPRRAVQAPAAAALPGASAPPRCGVNRRLPSETTHRSGRRAWLESGRAAQVVVVCPNAPLFGGHAFSLPRDTLVHTHPTRAPQHMPHSPPITLHRTLIRSFEREVYIIPNAVFSKNTVSRGVCVCVCVCV